MRKFDINKSSTSEIVSKTVAALSPILNLKRKEQYNALRLLLLNLYYDDEIIIERAKKSYGSNRYNPSSIGYSSIITVLDNLTVQRYIEQIIGSIKGGDRKRTTIKRTKKLESTFIEYDWYTNGQVNHWVREIYSPNQNPETIILRKKGTKSKTLIDYEDTAITNAMRKDMKAYNQLIQQYEISVPNYNESDNAYDYQGEPIARMFSVIDGEVDTFKYGGRLYASWCDLSKEMRARIQIDGEETIEEDFQASSINTLYRHLTGKIYQYGDPYQLSINDITIPRSFVKQLSTMIFFNNTIQKLGLALKKHYEQEEKDTVKISDYQFSINQFKIKEIVNAYQLKHKVISDYFMKDKQTGHHIQFLESELVMNVINNLTKLEIPVLTIYDSFIVQSRHRDLLLKHMY